MAFYICPNCKQRSVDHDGREGLLDVPVSCQRCGFGFLFELMEDYYPAPGTGMIVCDREGRILGVGRGVFELTGYDEPELIGRDLMDTLAISGFDEARNPAQLTLEWGVRRLGEQLELRTRSGIVKPIIGDFFPGYDRDGGLLVALSPR